METSEANKINVKWVVTIVTKGDEYTEHTYTGVGHRTNVLSNVQRFIIAPGYLCFTCVTCVYLDAVPLMDIGVLWVLLSSFAPLSFVQVRQGRHPIPPQTPAKQNQPIPLPCIFFSGTFLVLIPDIYKASVAF